jgi:hypothetical protein
LVGRSLPFDGKVFSGKFLMETGLNIPDRNYGGGTHRDFASHVLYLVAE